MINNNECLLDRDQEIYNEFLKGSYTLSELGEMYGLYKTRISKIVEKFLNKK